MPSYAKQIILFIFCFLTAVTIQSYWWTKVDLLDLGMWADQAKYVFNTDKHEFNAYEAYGHPGGPIIIGTIAVRKITGLTYVPALRNLMYYGNGLIIALICLLAYRMKKDNLWWLALLAVLSLDRMNEYATPPTAVVSLLIALLCMFTLYVYEKQKPISNRDAVIWAVIAGIAVATRVDIGGAMLIGFMIVLWPLVSWKKMLGMIAGAFVSFCIFDPFMWFMPVQHVWDIISKAIYHYDAKITPGHPQNWLNVGTTHLTRGSILDISAFVILAMVLAAGFIMLQKFPTPRKLYSSPLPNWFVYVIAGITVVLYAIFLTANYQAPRYFQPIVMIWQMFLPLYIFSFINQLHLWRFSPRSQQVIRWGAKIIVLGILIAYPAIILHMRMLGINTL